MHFFGFDKNSRSLHMNYGRIKVGGKGVVLAEYSRYMLWCLFVSREKL